MNNWNPNTWRDFPIKQQPTYPDLEKLIANMKETMYNASGVGLAAPQIGKAIRLFLIDASPFAEDDDLSEEERTVLKYGG